MKASDPCPAMPPTMEVQAGARHDLRVPSKERTLKVPVLGAPCMKRGDATLADEEIYEGYRKRLYTALTLLRSRFPRARLLVRNCHIGTQSSWLESRGVPLDEQPQRRALRRMNAIINAVAREVCAEVIDVWNLDVLAGGYVFAPDRQREDFHVPETASTHAALAALLALRMGGDVEQ